jgi:hypothetical protein
MVLLVAVPTTVPVLPGVDLKVAVNENVSPLDRLGDAPALSEPLEVPVNPKPSNSPPAPAPLTVQLKSTSTTPCGTLFQMAVALEVQAPAVGWLTLATALNVGDGPAHAVAALTAKREQNTTTKRRTATSFVSASILAHDPILAKH